MSETAAKKDVQKLQRVIVDALEDVKAQDIQVFNTEHLSPLFERVIIASGTSNRQTKALSASVRDKVRDAGFGKPRIEGEDNGEWIIADCGAAVVHIMQPVIRQYYNLEEIWGDKPVRLKFGAPKPEAKTAKAGKRTAHQTTARTLTPKEAAAAAKRAAAQAAASPGSAKSAPRKPTMKAAAGKTAVKTAAKAPAKAPAKTPTQKTGRSAAQTVSKKVVVGKPVAKAAAKKAAPARKPVKAASRKG